jgi:hypothetical protein
MALLAGSRLAQQNKLDVIPTDGLVALYDLTRVNLLAYSEGAISSIPIKGGTPAVVSSLPSDGFAEWFAFSGTPTASQYLYAPFAGAPVVGQMYTLSVYVRMDDGGAPNNGTSLSTFSFSLVLFGSVGVLNPTVTYIGNGIYRVSVSREYSATNQFPNNNGVLKYTTQDARGFKATGYQVNIGSAPLPYERGYEPQAVIDSSVKGYNIVPTDDVTASTWTKSGANVVPTGTLPSGSKTFKITYADATTSSPYIMTSQVSDAYALAKRTVRLLIRRISGTGGMRIRSGAGVPDYVLNLTSDWQEFTTTQEGGTLRYFLLLRLGNTGVDEVEVAEIQLNMGDYTAYERPVLNGVLGSTSGAEAIDPVVTFAGLSFDGTDDQVNISQAIDLNSDHTTIVVVTPTTPLATSDYRAILGVGGRTGTLDYESVAIGPSTYKAAISYRLDSNSTQRIIEYGDPIPINTTTMITNVSSDVSQNLGYINSVQKLKLDPQPRKPQALSNIGHRSGGRYFPGVIHYIMVYNRVLSQREVQGIYRALKKRLAFRGVTLS